MDGDSSVLDSSGEAVPPPADVAEGHEGGSEDGGGGGGAAAAGGGGGSNSAEEEDKGLFRDNIEEEGDKNFFGGNRWPRQETLALLKIRSDMDAVFRDATHKAPLWDEVSRKLGELGFNRTPKKCKEKFENVYKYHKRTKEGRSGKSDNSKKVYRFSDELEAFDNHHHQISFQSHHHQPPPAIPQPPTLPPYNPPATVPQKIVTTTVPSTMNTNNSNFPPNSCNNPLPILPNIAANVMFSSSTSSSTASDEDPFRSRRRRKRKWSDFFVRLTKEVIEKQEGLQLKFLEALERIENQRKLRDEAWRMKEMTRVNREHEVLVQEMSMAAAKDAAVLAFLQKITPLPPLPRPVNRQNGENGMATALGSPSRWPKAEVEALIRLRTEMEMKYQENGSKGLLWEEISAAMRELGYNRSSKRCKEKWENINKYFKKVKDSNKKRPEDSKTCPYFHQLDALYREKEKNSFDINSQMEPLMVEPEQQWPPPLQANQMMGNIQRINGEGNQEEEEEEEEEEEGEDGASSSTDVED